jgi:uncharacterized protein (DUF1501 family)
MSIDPVRAPSRREFLAAAACAPFAWAVPLRWLPGADDRTLVVLELAGGNDGLNTVIPIEDARWARLRPTLSSVRGAAHRIGEGRFALHPALAALAKRFDRGQLAIVHGVGYTPPDRSHFLSRDIWHASDPALKRVGAETTGWLGRAAEELAARGAAIPGAAIGSLRVPLCLRARRLEVPALTRLEDYSLVVDPAADDPARSREALAELARASSAHADLSRVAAAALDQSSQLERALARYRPRASWPEGPASRALQLAARVVVSGFGTRLLWIEQGGFDTHATQAPAHDALLRQLDASLGAFLDELELQGALDRTLVLVHSEFGRRVAENRSQGTDHGAAAPVFICGGAALRGGLHGEAPDLEKLDDGDLRCTTSFQAVHAELLRFLGVDPLRVLGLDFAPLGFLGAR